MTEQSAQELGLSEGVDVAGRQGVIARAFANRRFRLAFIVLLVAACGLHVTVNFMRIHLTKEAVPMRMPFAKAVPVVIGDEDGWVQVARQEVLNPDFKAALGTDEYLFCHYVRAREFGKTSQEILDMFKGKSLEEQQQEVAALASKKPYAVLGVGLTYYTGKVDTVAHIPERCYLGGGYDPEPAARPEPTFRLGKDPQRELHVRCLRFINPDTKTVRHVTYFFQVNGRYEKNSLAVREVLSNLFERRAYYAKVELSCEDPREYSAQESVRDFLDAALPYIEQALPDWDAERRK